MMLGLGTQTGVASDSDLVATAGSTKYGKISVSWQQAPREMWSRQILRRRLRRSSPRSRAAPRSTWRQVRRRMLAFLQLTPSTKVGP